MGDAIMNNFRHATLLLTQKLNENKKKREIEIASVQPFESATRLPPKPITTEIDMEAKIHHCII